MVDNSKAITATIIVALVSVAGTSAVLTQPEVPVYDICTKDGIYHPWAITSACGLDENNTLLCKYSCDLENTTKWCKSLSNYSVEKSKCEVLTEQGTITQTVKESEFCIGAEMKPVVKVGETYVMWSRTGSFNRQDLLAELDSLNSKIDPAVSDEELSIVARNIIAERLARNRIQAIMNLLRIADAYDSNAG